MADEAHRSHNVGLIGHIGLQIHPGKQMRFRFKDIEVSQMNKSTNPKIQQRSRILARVSKKSCVESVIMATTFCYVQHVEA